MSETSLQKKARKRRQEAVSEIVRRLRDERMFEVDVGAQAITVRDGDVSCWLRFRDEKPGGQFNGKVRITLMRGQSAERQFPETTTGINIDQIVSTTAAKMLEWGKQDKVRDREIKTEARLVSLANKYAARAARVGARLRVVDHAVEVVIPVANEDGLSAALAALNEDRLSAALAE